MSGILIYSELEEAALGLLTKGRELATKLGKPLSVALLGNEAADQADIYFAHGATQAYVGDDPNLTHFQARIYAAALAQMVTQAQADIVLIGSTRRGRELAPRLAQKFSAGCVTDAIGLSVQDQRLVIERRALGGNTVSAKVITSQHQVIAVMPKLYDAEPEAASAGEVIPVSLELEPPATKLIERRSKEAGVVNLEEAEVLVCVGRGLANKDDLSLIQTLADSLGGMVGCTRPISHEYHWLAEDQMVGLSGKEPSPHLYLAIGISGQIQHTVGIMDAKVIVAINNDTNAPIFKIADYGIVGDLYQVVPKLIERLQQELGR
ncbi:MAG TPA: electron transfer flavoprotein subunit alpha/FixB family protein [Anaerolineae bacterium]|nr:electron transfer flavoprotein subunit alpha/FixB family protein [Anaerolineae bacterium]